jgi:hypothetical protein
VSFFLERESKREGEEKEERLGKEIILCLLALPTGYRKGRKKRDCLSISNNKCILCTRGVERMDRNQLSIFVGQRRTDNNISMYATVMSLRKSV